MKNIDCSLQLFADDTSLYITVEFAQIAANLISTDLDTISTWAANWLVNFHERKCISMALFRKLLPPQHPPLFTNNIMLLETGSHKHLCLILPKSCTWSIHIQEIASKAWVRLNHTRTLKFRVSRKSLEELYNSSIRPLLEYCYVVWDNCSAENKKQLESIHIQCIYNVRNANDIKNIPSNSNLLYNSFFPSNNSNMK